MPANLYGQGDNFDLKSSHVLPALVKKITLAKVKNLPSVEVWGSGKVKREFLNVEDLSLAIYFTIKKKIKYDNATLRIYDYPIVYFPKFFHPDPTVNRQSGFLTTTIKNTNNKKNNAGQKDGT